MIELIVKRFLSDHLSVPAFLEREGEMPEKFVLFEKTSGGQKNQLSSATIVFQSYAESLYDAAMLNEELKAVVGDMITIDEISKIKLNSDYNFTDTTTKEYRYQAVFDINY
ncbi:hypothetical protein [Enterococcus rotai]|uniref:hypothetical protein n=1 Tax=Enterococcus rotai TaxID=118060 RepID=UPI0032B41A3A